MKISLLSFADALQDKLNDNDKFIDDSVGIGNFLTKWDPHVYAM